MHDLLLPYISQDVQEKNDGQDLGTKDPAHLFNKIQIMCKYLSYVRGKGVGSILHIVHVHDS